MTKKKVATGEAKKHVAWKPKHPKPFKENKVIKQPAPRPNNTY